MQLLCWLVLPMTAHATQFTIDQAQVYQVGASYTLNATINYSLTPRVQEALKNGVPITFFQDIQLLDRTPLLWDWWHWDEVIWSTEVRYELRYHDLSQQYMLHSLNAANHRNYTTLDSALNAMGNITNFILPPAFTEVTDNTIQRLRSGIDLTALPSPMRPGAMISSKWDLTSDWFQATWPSD
ncbi:MAG TPA: DUF4390 domain-containing protein [Methylophaga sp.]|nr:DUF4390 domain-containing protein [Methylophaga sp.]